METLSIKEMLRKKPKNERGEQTRNQERVIHRNIQDAGWYSFIQMVKYKCDWYGKNFIQIGRFEPSSKLCTCGFLNKELTLDMRKWKCPKCGIEHDRDILAANNIKFLGLEQPEVKASGAPELLGAVKEENSSLLKG